MKHSIEPVFWGVQFSKTNWGMADEAAQLEAEVAGLTAQVAFRFMSMHSLDD